MSNTVIIQLSTREFCRSANISTTTLREFVTTGIVEPRGESPYRWRFDDQMLAVARRAIRLQRELDIDWAGVAVAIELMERIERLRAENRQLEQRLARFLQE